MAETEELKSLLMNVMKEEREKVVLKLNIQKNKRRSWYPIPSFHGK